MEIKEIADGIYKVEGFISEDTADFIVNAFPQEILRKAPNGNTFGYLGTMYPKYLSKLVSYNDNYSHNVAVDLATNLLVYMKDIISVTYKEKHVLKQTFYSRMLEGGYNRLHTDNAYLDSKGIVTERIEIGKNFKDKSGLLYLTSNFSGGTLCFPNQSLEIKPEIGDFIFFEGSLDRPHEVKEVTDGVRCNLISFYEPDGYNPPSSFTDPIKQ